MILDEIVEFTRKRVIEEQNIISTQSYQKRAQDIARYEKAKGIETNQFETAIRKKGMSFICEVKKASPSKGIIAEEFDYIQIAKEYEIAGASAISVLTEPHFFQGKDQYLSEIKEQVKLPLLRKDFVISPYQIYQAKVIGASAILLICAILTQEELREYHALATELGLSVLVEAHDEREIDMAIVCGAKIIGVNNRNLKNFTVSIDNCIELRKRIPESILYIAESGMKTKEDIRTLYDAKVDAVLIGETMMRSENKKKTLSELNSLLPFRQECV